MQIIDGWRESLGNSCVLLTIPCMWYIMWSNSYKLASLSTSCKL